MKISRRSFLGAGALGLTGLIAGGGAMFSHNTSEPVLEHKKLVFPNLPAAFEGYRIGFISDIHLGAFVPDSLVEKTVEMLNSADIDLLLLGGDYIGIPDNILCHLFYNNRNEKFGRSGSRETCALIYRTLKEIISNAKTKDGVYAVLGNHDHWNDASLCREVMSGGIEFLVNDGRTIRRGSDSITLFGTDDFWTGIPDVRKLAGSDPGRSFRIVLSHNPDYLTEILSRSANFFDLALAGHTHGGQIKLPLLGAICGYNIRYNMFTEGHFRKGDAQVYVTRGVGVVDVPYRVNCPPEVSVIELTKTISA